MCRCIYSIKKKYNYIFIYNYISPQVSPKIGVFWATTFSPLTSKLSLSSYISHIFSCGNVKCGTAQILKIVMFYSSHITHSSYLSSSIKTDISKEALEDCRTTGNGRTAKREAGRILRWESQEQDS